MQEKIPIDASFFWNYAKTVLYALFRKGKLCCCALGGKLTKAAR